MRGIAYFSNVDSSKPISKSVNYFSVANDLKDKQSPPKVRYRNLLLEYQKFVLAKKSSLKQEDLKDLDALFISKFNDIVFEFENELREGQTLDTLLTIVETPVRTAAKLFSKAYKNLLLSRDKLDYIPPGVQVKVDEGYQSLISELRKVVFAPVINFFDDMPITDLAPSQLVSEPAPILKDHDELNRIHDLIQGVFRKENIEANIIIEDGKLIIDYEGNKNQIETQE